jgi:hypothetical protein
MKKADNCNKCGNLHKADEPCMKAKAKAKLAKRQKVAKSEVPSLKPGMSYNQFRKLEAKK